GKGISATVNGHQIRIGSGTFTNCSEPAAVLQTSVHVAIDGDYIGKFVFNNKYRDGMAELFRSISRKYQIFVLSGDNEGEREVLEQLLPAGTELVFNQKPEQKLAFVEKLQKQGRT